MKASEFSVDQVVFVGKVGSKVVNMFIKVDRIKKYKDGSFALYHSFAGCPGRLWSQTSKFTALISAKMVRVKV